MSIIKIVKTENYSQICNSLLNDPTLTLRSKGLLCYLISKPVTWNVNVNHLYKICKEGKDAIYSTINELIESGYIVRVRVKDDQGRHIGVNYHVYEEPQREIPNVESSDREKPDSNKERTLVNKEDSKGPALPAALRPVEKTIYQRQVEFLKLVIDWVALNPGKYPKLMYVEFSKYWVEPSMQKKKIKLRYEEQRFFDVARRLSTWFQKVKDDVVSEYWKKDTEIDTLNNLFKKQILNINNNGATDK